MPNSSNLERHSPARRGCPPRPRRRCPGRGTGHAARGLGERQKHPVVGLRPLRPSSGRGAPRAPGPSRFLAPHILAQPVASVQLDRPLQSRASGHLVAVDRDAVPGSPATPRVARRMPQPRHQAGQLVPLERRVQIALELCNALAVPGASPSGTRCKTLPRQPGFKGTLPHDDRAAQSAGSAAAGFT